MSNEGILVTASAQLGVIDVPTTREFMYQNDLHGMTIPDCFGFRIEPQSSEHLDIVDRCIDYFQRLDAAYDLSSLRNDDMWGRKIESQYGDFETALRNRNRDEVSDALYNMCTTGLVTGFTEGLLSSPVEGFQYSQVVQDGQKLIWEAWHLCDVLFSLAAALGHPIPCPEQGNPSLAYLDFETLLNYVIDRIPELRLPPRAGGGAFGITTVNGVIAIRELFAAYNAHTITGILENEPPEARNVCEIGGGTGALSYYLARMGNRVSLFDLPVVSVVQSYFLMTSLGQDQVWLSGEHPNSPALVRIFPWWQFRDAADSEYSLVTNVDSLPEIEAGAAQNYIELIHSKSRRWFFSVNQEARADNENGHQNVVADLVELRGGFKRRYRSLYWLRAGYVEELYRILK